MSKPSKHHRASVRAAIACALLAATVPGAAYAQSAEASLRGTAPLRSTVTVRNVATGLVRHTTVSEDGTYVLVGLPSGSYEVDAGPGTETRVTLAVASTTTLMLAAQLEDITVKGRRDNGPPAPEVRTPEVAFVVSLHDIETLPQVTRNFLEFADTVPGMQFSVDANGNSQLRGGGQNSSALNVFIDGVGQKSYVKDGGITGQVQTQGNPFPQLAIGSYKVITSNYKAEYDQVSSAAITAETKSGTNEFHGEAFIDYTDQGLRRKTTAEEAAGVKTPSRNNEYGFAIGGPIIADKMHFFATYEAKRFKTPASIQPGLSATETGVPITSILPPDVTSQFGPTERPFNSDLYFAKIDWEITSQDRLEVSGKWRKDIQANFGSGIYAPEHGTNQENTDTRLTARWQHSADRWTNELLLTYEDAFFTSRPRVAGNGAIFDYYNCSGVPGECSPNNYQVEFFYAGSAGPLDTQDKGQRGPGLQDDLTFTNLAWHGDHTVKLGFKAKNIDLKAIDAGGQGPQFYYIVTDGGVDPQPYYAFFAFPSAGQTPVVKTSDRQIGFYLQDDWQVNPHLIVNLGLRWDQERVPSYLDYVTPAAVVAGFAAQDPNAPDGQSYAQTLALGGIDISQYLSNGHNRKAPSDEWQPRLGFSYDIAADQMHVVFGGFGRSYDRDLFDYLQLENNKGALPQYFVAFNSPQFGGDCYPGVQCFAWDPAYLNGAQGLGPLAAGASPETDLLPNRLKVPYSDQFSIGMRNRLGAWNTSVTLSYVHSKDGFVFSWGNREPNGNAYNGGYTSGNGIPGLGLLILGDNGAETKTKQLLLSVEKPYTEESGWGFSAAYTYSDATMNRSINAHYSSEYPNIRDYPFILSDAVPKSRLVATASINGPWKTVVAAKLTLATPTPISYDANLNINESGNQSWWRPVSLRPTGGIAYKDLDLQVTKNFALPRGHLLYVRADWLNVFNSFNPDPNNSGYLVDYGDYSSMDGSHLARPVPNRLGNILGTPSTFKVSFGYKF
jgi:outer membrane receptor protein involved in Fe transport